MELLIWLEQMLHPEIREAMAEIGRRDLALLTEGGGALAMRPLYEDLDEEEQLRDLYQGQVGTDGPIVAVMILLPPPGREKPGRVPLSRIEALKWEAVGMAYDGLA